MSTFDVSLDDPSTSFSVPDDAYAAELETVAPTITDKIASLQAPGESWMDTLSKSLPILAATYQQKQILGVQIDRARAGLPPLKASEYAAGVQVGLSADTKQLLIYGAIGLGVILFMSRK